MILFKNIFYEKLTFSSLHLKDLARAAVSGLYKARDSFWASLWHQETDSEEKNPKFKLFFFGPIEDVGEANFFTSITCRAKFWPS